MGANEKLAAALHPQQYTCAECDESYTSIRAALLCEDADIAADQEARRS